MDDTWGPGKKIASAKPTTKLDCGKPGCYCVYTSIAYVHTSVAYVYTITYYIHITPHDIAQFGRLSGGREY